MKFLSPEVALCLNKSTIRPYVEYCCHVWAGAPSIYLELLDKLQKRIFRTVVTKTNIQDCWSFTSCFSWTLDSLLKCGQLKSFSLFFYRWYFGRCSSELAQLVPLPFFSKESTLYSDKLHDFSVTIRRCYKDVYVNSFFPCTAQLWNFLPIECFPLAYNLNGFKSRMSRHLLTVGSFWRDL